MPVSDAIRNTQHVYDLVELCAHKGVRHAVLCPGSRCAPLLIGFGKHAKIKTISVTDERSAGFIGLGIAQQTNTPVALICTSGTAGQNFAPAVTEAFYQNVALIVLTADRPPEWIDQWDGQTIHQQTLYGEHIRASMDFQAGNNALNQAQAVLDQAVFPVAGPVHINIPIRKPFYPQKIEEIHFPTLDLEPPPEPTVQVADKHWAALENILKTADKVLIIAGQQRLDRKLLTTISRLGIPLLGDVISNVHPDERAIQSTDIFFDLHDDSLRPDFLITIGRSVISENLKQYFRRYKPLNHWHIGQGMVGDPFQSLSLAIDANAHDFFRAWLNRDLTLQNQLPWKKHLRQNHKRVHAHISVSIHTDTINQFITIRKILGSLLEETNILHLGNSMPVRVANYTGLHKAGPEVFCNRGTSGIDGSLSTAVGHALARPDRVHTLILGDLSFFYDRNGLWINQTIPPNLKIIVINNAGGGIFSLLPGPADQGKLVKLFTTPHQRSVELAAEEFSLAYFSVCSLSQLDKTTTAFLALPNSAILEVLIHVEEDEHIFRRLNQRPLNDLETD